MCVCLQLLHSTQTRRELIPRKWTGSCTRVFIGCSTELRHTTIKTCCFAIEWDLENENTAPTQQLPRSELDCNFSLCWARCTNNKQKQQALITQVPPPNREARSKFWSKGSEENKKKKCLFLFFSSFIFWVFLPSSSVAVINYSGCEPEGEKHGWQWFDFTKHNKHSPRWRRRNYS